jgi:transcriptional regulator with XRE-family HTH domain
LGGEIDSSLVGGANVALRNRMLSRGFSKARLAASTQIDERSIQRWMDGQVRPHAENARRVATALECEPSDLWPEVFSPLPSAINGSIAATVYTSRAHIPVGVWINLFSTAAAEIDICVYGGTFLYDTVPGFNRLMANAADRGVSMRLLVGDPSCESVRRRGEEEGIGTSLPSRCALTLDRLAPLASRDGIELRVHSTTLYASMFRIDDSLIANHHILGSPASDNPAIQFTRSAGENLWNTYADAFSLIWSSASPPPARKDPHEPN